MRWRLLGIVPLVRAAGPDVSRSAIGRMHAESCWLPSSLLLDGTGWVATGESRVGVEVGTVGSRTPLELTVAADGAPRALVAERWGDAGEGRFGLHRFGAFVEAEATFDGYTIPVRMRAGWHPGEAGFTGIGEFFRVVVDDARFR